MSALERNRRVEEFRKELRREHLTSIFNDKRERLMLI